MGVNLPAHLVVIKSTAQYIGGAYEEYSTAQLLQMTGRAGRPQFDTHATAVIMTKMQHKVKLMNAVSTSSGSSCITFYRLNYNSVVVMLGDC